MKATSIFTFAYILLTNTIHYASIEASDYTEAVNELRSNYPNATIIYE